MIYVVKEGEDTILYASDDDGATWNKTVNPKDGQLPQGPSETLDMFSGEGVNIQLTGVEEVNGKPAKVYAGTIDGKLLQQVLNTSGAMNELSEAMGAMRIGWTAHDASAEQGRDAVIFEFYRPEPFYR